MRAVQYVVMAVGWIAAFFPLVFASLPIMVNAYVTMGTPTVLVREQRAGSLLAITFQATWLFGLGCAWIVFVVPMVIIAQHLLRDFMADHAFRRMRYCWALAMLLGYGLLGLLWIMPQTRDTMQWALTGG
jgi:hypothetical protein